MLIKMILYGIKYLLFGFSKYGKLQRLEERPSKKKMMDFNLSAFIYESDASVWDWGYSLRSITSETYSFLDTFSFMLKKYSLLFFFTLTLFSLNLISKHHYLKPEYKRITLQTDRVLVILIVKSD